MRFSAVFLPAWNLERAVSSMGPVAVLEERASKRRDCSSRQAVSKCSKFVRIWTTWPGYWELSLSMRDWQTFSQRSSSRDCGGVSLQG
jgi:hypothetical protein